MIKSVKTSGAAKPSLLEPFKRAGGTKTITFKIIVFEGQTFNALRAGTKIGVDREKVMQNMRASLPLEGRWGAAQDVADAVAWLASDKAGYVTGQVIRVDGGMIV